MSNPTIVETHVHVEDKTTITYNSQEFAEEISELDAAELKRQLDAPVGDNVDVIATELTKKDPNYVKIGLSAVFIIISLLGTFFGLWFGTGK